MPLIQGKQIAAGTVKATNVDSTQIPVFDEVFDIASGTLGILFSAIQAKVAFNPLSYAIVSGSWSAGVATVVIGPHVLAVGTTFSISGCTPSGYNVDDVLITAVTSTSISYAVVSDPGSLTVYGQVFANPLPLYSPLVISGCTPSFYNGTNSVSAYTHDSVVYFVPSQSNTASISGASSLDWDSGARTLTRTGGSWITDGFVVGTILSVISTASVNFGPYQISSVTSTVLTFAAGQAITTYVGDAPAAANGALVGVYHPITVPGTAAVVQTNVFTGQVVVPTPTNGPHATTKTYVDTAVANAVTIPTSVSKNIAALTTTADGQLASNGMITTAPTSHGYIEVSVNGLVATVADGPAQKTTSTCYFSGNGGTTARSFSTIAVNDQLYWNGSVAGYQLATTDVISFNYDVSGTSIDDTLSGAAALFELADVSIPTPADGDVLKYDGVTLMKWVSAAGPNGSKTLAGLSDVVLTTPVVGDALVYNSGTSKWINSPGAVIGSIVVISDPSASSLNQTVFTSDAGSISGPLAGGVFFDFNLTLKATLASGGNASAADVFVVLYNPGDMTPMPSTHLQNFSQSYPEEINDTTISGVADGTTAVLSTTATMNVVAGDILIPGNGFATGGTVLSVVPGTSITLDVNSDTPANTTFTFRKAPETITFTGTSTNTSPTITTSNTLGLIIGDTIVSGTGFSSLAARIVSIVPDTSVTLDANATSGGTGSFVFQHAISVQATSTSGLPTITIPTVDVYVGYVLASGPGFALSEAIVGSVGYSAPSTTMNTTATSSQSGQTYYFRNAAASATMISGTSTNGSATITTANTTGVSVGDFLASGPGFAADVYGGLVTAVVPNTSIDVSYNASSGNGAGAGTFTFYPVSASFVGDTTVSNTNIVITGSITMLPATTDVLLSGPGFAQGDAVVSVNPASSVVTMNSNAGTGGTGTFTFRAPFQTGHYASDGSGNVVITLGTHMAPSVVGVKAFWGNPDFGGRAQVDTFNVDMGCDALVQFEA